MSDKDLTPSEQLKEAVKDIVLLLEIIHDENREIYGALNFTVGDYAPKTDSAINREWLHKFVGNIMNALMVAIQEPIQEALRKVKEIESLHESAIALYEMRSQMEAIQIQPRPMLPHVHTPECRHEAEGSDYAFPLAPLPHSGNEEDFRFSLLAEQAKALQRWSQKQQRPITARDVQRAPKLPQLKNFSADQIRELFRLLESKGFGSTSTVGYSFTYTPNRKTFDSNAELLRSHAN